MLINKLQINK